MSTELEARIAEVLGAHRIGEILHTDKDYGHWKVACTACEWVTEYSDGAAEEHLAHITAMLAPVIREAQAEAWDKGHLDGDTYQYFGGMYPKNPNPYRSTT